MPSLLFVDDDEGLRRVFRRAGELHGFVVYTAPDGAAGLQAAIERRPDLIVLDVTMPLRDGRDVCRDLKARDDTQGIPVLFLSARGDLFDRRLCLELGAEDYIEKPFDLDALMRKIRYTLSKVPAGHRG